MSSPKIRRDVFLLCGVSVLALLPLGYLWRKSVLSRQSQGNSMYAAFTFTPSITPVPEVNSSSPQISPDGRWIARMESNPPATSSSSSSGGSTVSNSPTNQLVIRSASTGNEVFRDLPISSFLGWVPNSSDFVAQSGGSIDVYTPVKGGGTTPGGGSSPKGFWTQQSFVFPSRGQDPDFGGEEPLQTGSIAFSPDFRYAVRATWDNGPVEWEVLDLKTGKVTAPIRAGYWLNYDPNVGGYSSKIGIAVAPAGVSKGALPLVTLMQSSEIAPKYNPHPAPTPTATPYPTPAPTPTYSPAQTQFMQKKKKEEAEIQKIVDSVEGVDGSDPTVTDEEEIKRLTAEVRRRNHALLEETDHMFPLQKQQRDATNAAIASQHSKGQTLADGSPFQVEGFDLNTRQRVWKTSVVTEIFEPGIGFSPDGKSLLTWGTVAQIKENNKPNLQGGYIDFRNPLTGKIYGRNRLYQGSFAFTNDSKLLFYTDAVAAHSILALQDSYWESGPLRPTPNSAQPNQVSSTKYNSVLRFFDTSNAREIGHLKYLSSPEGPSGPLSTDQSGTNWLLGDKTLYRIPRAQLGQENSGPLPTPKSRF